MVVLLFVVMLYCTHVAFVYAVPRRNALIGIAPLINRLLFFRETGLQSFEKSGSIHASSSMSLRGENRRHHSSALCFYLVSGKPLALIAGRPLIQRVVEQCQRATPDAFPIPSWQQLKGVINSANKGSTTLRNSPDVSAEANNDFYACADQGACQTGWGGTSFAAPMWAGFMALVNQQAAAGGAKTVGFINPLIYPLGVSSGYGAAFHDITSGNNGYPAVTGYDLATGWGSPNGAGLIKALAASQSVGAAATLSPSSLAWEQTVVGETAPAEKTVTVTNSGSATLNISSIVASGDFAVTQIANSCGSTLAEGDHCVIKVTFTPTQLGTRTGAITISDNASGSPQTVPLSGTGSAQATLTPVSRMFPAEKVGTGSPAWSFTLSNKQDVALTGISKKTTGDFSISATTCSSTLAAKSDCTFSVVFKPTQTGTRTGTLQVSDSAVGGPQTSSLTGTGK